MSNTGYRATIDSDSDSDSELAMIHKNTTKTDKSKFQPITSQSGRVNALSTTLSRMYLREPSIYQEKETTPKDYKKADKISTTPIGETKITDNKTQRGTKRLKLS
jgi:hypothetical protein